MATPMSAALSAGASFTPSPVMATSSPCGLQRGHQAQLVLGAGAGDHIGALRRARRARRRRASRAPRRSARCSCRRGPAGAPMAAAVTAWSPVIITTRMPAPRHSATAAIASGRGGSIMPTRPSRVKPRRDVGSSPAPWCRAAARSAPAPARAGRQRPRRACAPPRPRASIGPPPASSTHSASTRLRRALEQHEGVAARGRGAASP